MPSPELVEIAFNQREFESRAGLYYLGDPGERIESSDKIRAITYADKNGCLVGSLFYFRGFRFLLYIDQDGPGAQVHLLGPPDAFAVSRPMYHLHKIRAMIGKLYPTSSKFIGRASWTAENHQGPQDNICVP